MIVFNEDGCIKCGACEGTCPTSAIAVTPESIIHCDTCGEEPKCADVCPNGALKAEAFEIADGVIQKRLHRHLVFLLFLIKKKKYQFL